jgi:hypothetical protein
VNESLTYESVTKFYVPAIAVLKLSDHPGRVHSRV